MRFQFSIIIAQLAILAKSAPLSDQEENNSGSLSQTLSIPTEVSSGIGLVAAVTSTVQTTESANLSVITPSTVYAFSGESGSASDVLQLPTGSSDLLSSSGSDTMDDSSALSQFLNGGTAPTSRTGLTRASSAPVSKIGSSSSHSNRGATQLAANSSTIVTSDLNSTSSTHSLSASGGANKVALPAIAGGLIAGVAAFL